MADAEMAGNNGLHISAPANMPHNDFTKSHDVTNDGMDDVIAAIRRGAGLGRSNDHTPATKPCNWCGETHKRGKAQPTVKGAHTAI